MYFARDVRDSIITRLGSSSDGINAQLTTIDTNRSTSTPQYKQLTYGEDLKSYPAVLVDLGNSEFEGSRGADYKTTREIFTLAVGVIVDDGNLTACKNYVENYTESIMRSLQGYEFCGTNNFEYYYCTLNSIERLDLSPNNVTTTLAAVMYFSVYRNINL